MRDDETTGRYDPDTFDLRSTVLALSDAASEHKAVLLLTVCFTVGLAWLYTYLWPPIYRAEALLMVERDVDAARDNFYGAYFVRTTHEVRSR